MLHVQPLLLRGSRILRRLGRVLHVSQSRNIILKGEGTPKIGQHVVDESLTKVGVVSDVLGPTSSPYVSVRPTAKHDDLARRVLYVRPRERRKERS